MRWVTASDLFYLIVCLWQHHIVSDSGLGRMERLDVFRSFDFWSLFMGSAEATMWGRHLNGYHMKSGFRQLLFLCSLPMMITFLSLLYGSVDLAQEVSIRKQVMIVLFPIFKHERCGDKRWWIEDEKNFGITIIGRQLQTTLDGATLAITLSIATQIQKAPATTRNKGWCHFHH